MKFNYYFATACVVVGMVFGFCSCTYDTELQAPKHLVEQAAAQNQENAGKTVTLQTGTRIVENTPR